METKTMPSGAELRITLAPFKDAKALYQAVLEELRTLSPSPDADITLKLLQDFMCMGFSSKKIEGALGPCLSRCLYNGRRIDSLDEIFESEAARGDYMQVCWEVAHANVAPFMKHLRSLLAGILNPENSLGIKPIPEQKTGS